MSLLAVIFLVAAWVAKHFWRRNMLNLVPLSTPESATGLGSIGKVRLFERPHVNENYLTREMGFKVVRKHAAKLWKLAVVLGGIVPVAMLLLVAAARRGAACSRPRRSSRWRSTWSACCVERWLFFAEARHAVMNYYGG